MFMASLPVTLATVLPPEVMVHPRIVEHQIETLETDFERSPTILEASKRQRSRNVWAQFLGHLEMEGLDLPKWAQQMKVDPSLRHAKVLRVNVTDKNVREMSMPAKSAAAITKELAYERGRLLQLGGHLSGAKVEAGTHAFLPKAVVARLLMGGRDMTTEKSSRDFVIPGAHPMRVVFVNQPVSQDLLRQMVANLEWPIVLPNTKHNFRPARTVVRETELQDYHAYLRLLADMTDWLRHARWPLGQRVSLPVLYDVLMQTEPKGFDLDRASMGSIILRGPSPFYFKKGYIGALFYALTQTSFKPHLGDPAFREWLGGVYNELRKKIPEGDPRRKDLSEAMAYVSGEDTSNARFYRLRRWNNRPQ